MIQLVSLILTSTLGFSATIQGNPNTEYGEYDAASVERIKIVNTSGRTVIAPMVTTKVVVSIQKRKFNHEKCTAKITRPDFATVVVEIKRPLGEHCEADITVQAPKKVNLDIASGSGSVNVKGVSGDLAFSLGSGKIEADGRFTKVLGTSGSGSVVIDGVVGGGSLDVGSGQIQLSFLDEVQGSLKVQNGSGDALLKVPRGTKLSAFLGTGSGSVSNDFDQHSKPEFHITAEAGSGDLQIKSY